MKRHCKRNRFPNTYQHLVVQRAKLLYRIHHHRSSPKDWAWAASLFCSRTTLSANWLVCKIKNMTTENMDYYTKTLDNKNSSSHYTNKNLSTYKTQNCVWEGSKLPMFSRSQFLTQLTYYHTHFLTLLASPCCPMICFTFCGLYFSTHIIEFAFFVLVAVLGWLTSVKLKLLVKSKPELHRSKSISYFIETEFEVGLIIEGSLYLDSIIRYCV